jgi:hypothetical protein
MHSLRVQIQLEVVADIYRRRNILCVLNHCVVNVRVWYRFNWLLSLMKQMEYMVYWYIDGVWFLRHICFKQVCVLVIDFWNLNIVS